MRIIFNRFLKLLKIYNMNMYQYIINQTHEYVDLMNVIKFNFDTTKYLTKNKDLNGIINGHWYPCFCGFAKYGGILQEKFDLLDLIAFNTDTIKNPNIIIVGKELRIPMN